MSKDAVKPKSKSKLFYVTVLNVLACFAVVAMHCSGEAFWFQPVGSTTWVTASVAKVLCCWAVPIFFMITGVTLVDYRERYDDKTFFKKRFAKTLIPFLVWSLISYVFWVFWSNGGEFYRNPLRILSGIINYKFFGIYWFFPALFAIYMSLPVITRVNEKLKTFRYAIMLGVVFVVLLPFACDLMGTRANGELTPPIVLGYMLYVFLGYVLSKTTLSRRLRWVIYLFGVIGVLVQFVGTWVMSVRAGTIMSTYRGLLNPTCFMISIAVFVFFRHLDYERILAKFKKVPLKKIFGSLAGLTFGIYLIHYYIIYALPAIFGFSAIDWRWRTLGVLVVFALSAGAVWVLKRIPWVRKIVP